MCKQNISLCFDRRQNALTNRVGCAHSAARQPWGTGQSGLPGQQVDEYTIPDKGGYAGANYPGHIGPFGLHDWTDRGQRSNGAFAAVPFIEYFESTGDVEWLASVGFPFVGEIARFYESYVPPPPPPPPLLTSE